MIITHFLYPFPKAKEEKYILRPPFKKKKNPTQTSLINSGLIEIS